MPALFIYVCASPSIKCMNSRPLCYSPLYPQSLALSLVHNDSLTNVCIINNKWKIPRKSILIKGSRHFLCCLCNHNLCVCVTLHMNALKLLWVLWFEENQIYLSPEGGHQPHVYIFIQRVNGRAPSTNMITTEIIFFFCRNPRMFLK